MPEFDVESNQPADDTPPATPEIAEKKEEQELDDFLKDLGMG